MRSSAMLSSFESGLRSLFLMLAGLLSLTACTTAVVPPASPIAPVSIFILDHGQHSSLLLPTETGGGVRYAYGDWAYYVEDRKSVFSGLRALAWPSRAALGRQQIAAPLVINDLSSQIGLVVIEAHEVRVAAAQVERLHFDLDRLFADSSSEPTPGLSNPSHFVEYPVPYSLVHNSNQVVGQWLTELQCTVIGRPLLSNWRIMPAATD